MDHPNSAVAASRRTSPFRPARGARLPAVHPFRASLDGHHRRVGAMARAVARRLGLDSRMADAIGAAAARHDVGKLFLDRAILALPRPLTEAEQAHVQRHALLGHAALGQSAHPADRLAARVALEHHEQWDGGGYPFALKGDAICLEARIVAVCDVYDALREARSYKPAYDHGAAMAVLTQGDSRVHPAMFDPEVLAVVRRDDGGFLDQIACGRGEPARRVA